VLRYCNIHSYLQPSIGHTTVAGKNAPQLPHWRDIVGF
jgi:hypothetical protein